MKSTGSSNVFKVGYTLLLIKMLIVRFLRFEKLNDEISELNF